MDERLRERVGDHPLDRVLSRAEGQRRVYQSVVREVGVKPFDLREIDIDAPYIGVEIRDGGDLVPPLLAAQELLPDGD